MAKSTFKTGLVGAVVGAGIGAAAIALSDKNNRKKAIKTVRGISEKTSSTVSDLGKKTQETMQDLSKKADSLKNGKAPAEAKKVKKAVNKASEKALKA